MQFLRRAIEQQFTTTSARKHKEKTKACVFLWMFGIESTGVEFKEIVESVGMGTTTKSQKSI